MKFGPRNVSGTKTHLGDRCGGTPIRSSQASSRSELARVSRTWLNSKHSLHSSVRLLRAFPDLPVRSYSLNRRSCTLHITQQHTSIAKLGAPAAFQQSRPTSPIGSHTHHWPLTCIRVRRPLPPKRIPQHWIHLGIYGIQGLRARRTAKWDRDGRR